MKGFDPIKSWDAESAKHYATHLRGDEADAAAFLFSYANGENALEFAIGTGRIGIPLKEKGVDVHGIEGSPQMIDQLHAHPVGKGIPAVAGDMSIKKIDQQFKLVYLVYNTIFNLLTADDQIRCFKNAAHHLTDDGVFVVETAVPHAWIAPGKSDYVKAEYVGAAEVGFDVARYDPATQLFERTVKYSLHKTGKEMIRSNYIYIIPVNCVRFTMW
ncbi:MAG: class I SAM-dependent methyltransferase [Chloroflexota bacterium]